MNFRDFPRIFSPADGIQLQDMGDIYLGEGEQITFRTRSGRCNDIVKKEWGFYISNSINWNLKRQGFKTALVISHASDLPRIYVNLVEVDKLDVFRNYLSGCNSEVVCWLDDWVCSES